MSLFGNSAVRSEIRHFTQPFRRMGIHIQEQQFSFLERDKKVVLVLFAQTKIKMFHKYVINIDKQLAIVIR